MFVLHEKNKNKNPKVILYRIYFLFFSVKSSYTTWFNPRTGNNGDIKINRTYVIDSGMKCSDYISTMNITTQWPIAGINRSTEFGTACQHPDGVWEVVNATS